MAALDVIGNEEYDEFDDSQLDATNAVGQASPPAVAAATESAEEQSPASKADAADEQSTDGEVERDEKGRFIPRHRYNFQRDQRVAAERQLQEAQQRLAQYEAYIRHQQAQQAQPERVDYDTQIAEIDQKIEDARADGDTSLANKLRTQQRQLERQAVIEQMQAYMPRQQQIDPRELAQQAAESTRLESTITRLEQQYPMLDETHDTFDPEVSDEIMNLYDSLRARMPLSQAMDRAVTYVTRAHGINPAEQKPARKNVERNIRAAAAQPPELDGVGMDSAKAGVTRSVDIAKMTQDQFEALDDAEIEKLLAAA